MDTYALPPQPLCSASPPPREPPPRQPILSGKVEYKQQAYGARTLPPPATLGRHHRDGFPLPPGWTVEFQPQYPTLAPEEDIVVKGVIRPPDAFRGEQRINVNAFRDGTLVGGVTIIFVAA